MAILDTAENVITQRSKDAISRHKTEIIRQFCKGAQAQGHNVQPSDVTSVTFKDLNSMKYTVPDLKFGKFVIEDAKDHKYLDGTIWDNNLPTEGNDDFVVNKTTTDTFTWSVTAGISYGAKVGGKVDLGVPGISGEVSTELSVDTTVSATQGSARSFQRSWTKKIGATVPAYYHYEKRAYATQVRGHVPFTITATATGKVDINIEYSFHGKRSRIVDTDLAKLIGKQKTVLTQSGVISGIQGYDWYVDTGGHPLSEDEKHALPELLSKHHAMTLELGASAEPTQQNEELHEPA